MPTLPVNDSGANIYYEDSGALAGATDYTTIVVIHSLIFHGAVFRPTFSYAAAHNMRLVALNLRDYPGSTALSPAELGDLCSPNIEKQRAAFCAQGMEIATFLKNFVEMEQLPPCQVVHGRRTGGVVLLAWSIATIHALAMLGNEASLSDDVRFVLANYLRTCVLYDPAHFGFGLPLPDTFYFPGQDPAVTREELPFALSRWATAFYAPLPELTDDARTVAGRGALHELTTDPRFVPTFDQLSRPELLAIADPTVLGRSARCLHTTHPSVWRDNAERALFNYDAQGPLKRVDILILWSDMAVNSSVYGASYAARRFAEDASQGKAVRKSRVLKIEGANHMIHWHDPEKFVRMLAENLQ